jgi:hypothetical protein
VVTLRLREFRPIPNDAPRVRQRPGLKFENHEGFRAYSMFVLEARCRSRHKSELWVERRMTDNHDQAMTLGPTRVETRAHKLRTNALPLVLRQYGHWRKTDRRLC